MTCSEGKQRQGEIQVSIWTNARREFEAYLSEQDVQPVHCLGWMRTDVVAGLGQELGGRYGRRWGRGQSADVRWSALGT